MNIVDIQNLTFSFSKKAAPVIKDFTFTMDKGEIVGVLGSSGSGKSTLLRLIAGLEMPTSGNITIASTTVVNEKLFIQPENRGVGMVFQDYALFPHMSVKDNILFGLSRLSKKERQLRLIEMLDLVQLKDFGNRYPHELSGGQQQRVALARALAPKPNLLLMDEPFSNLDSELKECIREDLRRILKTADMTCIMVSHDKKDVESICDRSIIFGKKAVSLNNIQTKVLQTC
ncbi:ABC transporter ATP-binding protein [Pseudoneobacillus rhizosphaerae]|jgi:iron(III) transport system ATP-binding protein|uniref:Carnitine transport ATP-binding protein OpuCA n=1 Tax=Pseudoneobacillus rhizosphaerae TaxID=2880968 RepID=A0A9C7LCB3_9BACI|nr:ABC transporter ATP-binding protein [Pseudoneobacillus rhizosphaerae]CAG9610382.1 Sulfate/thiosulfate import ATP-binding protein CysA [Pseudoneobacillus rhizosphaerae]